MKHTKGRQKIEMKKVEAYTDRMVTFSKRKSGIFKKMNEIVTQCDVEMAFLLFSETGKLYTFANPSLEEALGRLKSPSTHEPSASTSIKLILEAHKKQRSEVLMKKYVDLVEELEIKTEKENNLKNYKKEKKLENVWWNISAEGFSVEGLKKKHQLFLDSHVWLKAERFGKET